MTTTATAEKVPVGQIKISNMNAATMLATLKRLEIKRKFSTATAMHGALKKHYESKVADPKQLLHCENCGGLSTADEKACPYCGDVEVDAPTQVETTGETVVDETLPASEPKSATRRLKSVPGGKADKPKNEKKAEPAAIAKAGDAALATVTIVDLDSAVERARLHRGNSVESLWKLGNEIKDIYDRELWTLRLGDDSKPKYTRFNAFCESELGLSKTTAYGLMEIVKTFDVKQIEKHGTEKLKLLLSVPETERQRLLDGNASTRDIRRERGHNVGTAPQVEPGDVQGAVTVAIRVSEEPVRIAMTKANGAKGKKAKPATSLADLPTCEEEHENGVVSRYTVVVEESTGHIFLQRITTRS